jgi:MoaA/NifB/PqqE/SkfB family radical SAM enzyme
MCDIWKANATKNEISAEELLRHVLHFKNLGVREVAFSGGEALMHSNLWRLCEVLRQQEIGITLLSTGLLLERSTVEIISNFKEVIVSIDGSPRVHDAIRNIPNGFQKLSAGIAALKHAKPDFRITARCVLQRHNFLDFENIIRSVKEMGIDQISFLPADISTGAFNHIDPLSRERVHEIALDKTEVNEFEKIIDDSFNNLKGEYASGFIAESPKKMRRIVDYYKAVNGISSYPVTACNAPWVSAVIESDGRVMPCFFHKPYGNIVDNDLMEILNSPEAIAFRKNLDVIKDPICQRCVCSLKIGRIAMI